jgi:hypothetical protein
VPNVSSPEAAYYLLALIVPGVIFTYARSQFTNGRMLPGAGAVLHYIAITAVYYALATPLIVLAHRFPAQNGSDLAGWAALLFIAPGVLGGLSGWSARKEYLYKFLRKLKLNPVHPFPTAWDWRFADCPAQFILVTLKNGRQFGALCGQDSFLSTDPSERDVYLERTFDINARTNKWKDRGYSPMLIAAGEISTIEFMTAEGERDDRQEAAS